MGHPVVQIQILQSAPNEEAVRQLELIWTRRLFAFQPTGLNIREEDCIAGSSQ